MRAHLEQIRDGVVRRRGEREVDVRELHTKQTGREIEDRET